MTEAENGGERIAKAIARAGVMSRRDAEKAIVAGRVSVNGKPIGSPALDVGPKDKVAIDGKPIDAPQETRLWLYYKPLGLVVSEKDEKGRQTVFDTLPEGMPRVMSVGRLDLNSEGLLLLTNDGGLKRRLEMPATGWLRKYRVRVNGRPTDETVAPLRAGITIDGEDFQPMEISIDRQQGANAWLTVGIREGRNREVRRALAEVGLTVNRLIRLSYGPFRLQDMKPGDIEEVRRKLLRDQLGGLLTGEVDEAPKRRRPAEGAKPRKPRAAGAEGDRPRRSFGDRPQGDRPDRKPRAAGAEGDRPRKSWGDRPQGDRPDRKPRAAGAEGDRPRKSWGDRPQGDRPDRKPRAAAAEGDRPHKSWGDRPQGDRPDRKPRAAGAEGDRPRKSWGDRPQGDRPDRKPRAAGAEGDRPRKSWGDKPQGDRPDRKPRAAAAEGDRPRKSWGDKPQGDRPDRKPRAAGAEGDRPRKSWGDRPQGDRPGGKPAGGRPGAPGGGRPGGKPDGKPGGKPGPRGAGGRGPGGKPPARRG